MPSATIARPVVRAHASNHRFVIMGLLFVTVVINYLDRANLSIAAPASPQISDWTRLGTVLVRRKLWDVYFGHYATATKSSFFSPGSIFNDVGGIAGIPDRSSSAFSCAAATSRCR
jgi:hypothetical protein